MIPVFILTTRGLESVTRDELASLDGVTTGDMAYRRVMATSESLAPLLALRTADDAYLHLATWQEVGHTREMLSQFQALAAALNVAAAAETLRPIREISPLTAFSVTASFVGKRNYNADEIKRAIADGITEANDWAIYMPDDSPAALNIRIFIDHDTAFVGLRLGLMPLHGRPYKSVERAGALKPPVAAAMLHLAGLTRDSVLLDPCCGSGTVLIEAALMGARPVGGDIDAPAIQAARANMRNAGVHLRIDQWDARYLPMGDACIDLAVSNLPWGRQIAVDEALTDLYESICFEIERVLRVGGRVALLTTSPDLLRFPTLTLTGQHEISLFGQTPVISLFEKRA